MPAGCLCVAPVPELLRGPDNSETPNTNVRATTTQNYSAPLHSAGTFRSTQVGVAKALQGSDDAERCGLRTRSRRCG